MAIALVANTSAAATGSGTGATTPSINTTGANLLVVAMVDYSASAAAVLSDNKGNTWVPRTPRGVTDARVKIYECLGGTVGSGHTFNGAGTATYLSLYVAAFSGVASSSAFDQQNGATNGAAASSLSTGSVTPTVADELLIAGFAEGAAATVAINAGFTITNQAPYVTAQHFGGALAYLINSGGSGVAVNPAWSFAGTISASAAIATYKPAAATGYTLTAVTGTFTETGIAATLRASRNLVAATGTFAETGIAASLRTARRLVTTVGAFTVTGTATGLRAARRLPATLGTFALTGTATGLRAARQLSATVAAFTVSGASTGLRAARSLPVTVGTFALSGVDAGLSRTRRLVAGVGAFLWSGIDVLLTRSGGISLDLLISDTALVPDNGRTSLVCDAGRTALIADDGRTSLVCDDGRTSLLPD